MKVLELLEKLLVEWLICLEGVIYVVEDIFYIYDLDGDGFIICEEWVGIDVVFDVLDINKDGKIFLEEMVFGLGVVFELVKV